MMNEPVADFGAPSRSGAAAGCWPSGSAASASHGLGGARPSATISCSMRISSSAGLRRNGKREPNELSESPKRILNAGGALDHRQLVLLLVGGVEVDGDDQVAVAGHHRHNRQPG